MADKRISQLTDRGTVANSDVVPIVVSGAVTTNKATISSIQTFMQGNLDLGVTSVGITLGSSGTDVNVSGSPVTSSGNITINIPSASATNRGLVTTGAQTIAGNKTTTSNIDVNGVMVGRGASSGDVFAGIAGNTAVGSSALLSITTGFPNTALGSEALRNITTGANNIAIGSEAGKIDSGSSTANATSSSSIYIGNNTKPQTNGNTNEIVIGHATSGNGSNSVTIGTSSTTLNKFFGTTLSDAFRLPSDGGGNQITIIENIGTIHEGTASINKIGFNSSNNIYFGKGLSDGGVLTWSNSEVRSYTLPNVSGIIALTTNLTDFVTLSTVQTITAQKTFTTSGGTDSVIITTTGAGFALDAIKAGNGEVIRVNKTSGTGNAMTVIGGNFEAPTIVKTGGTSSQFLKADGSVDSSTYLTTGSAASTYLPLAGGTLTGALNGTSASFTGDLTIDTNTLFVNSSTNMIGMGTTSPTDFGSGYTGLSIDNVGAGGGVLNLMQGGARKLTIAVDGGNVSFAARTSGESIVFRTNDGTIATRLTLASTGAATFSSSVQATAMSIGVTPTANILVVKGENATNDGTIQFGARGYLQHRDAGQTITSLANDYNNDAAKIEFRVKGNSTSDAKMTILGSGNVGIGTASPFSTAKLQIKTATDVNLAFQTSTLDATGIQINAFNDAASVNIPIALNGSVLYFTTSTTERMRITSVGNTQPGADNAYSLGVSGTRWSAVWAANGTIQTSDEREKKDIIDSDLGLDFVNQLRPVSFKWKVGQNVVTSEVVKDDEGNPILDEEGNEKTESVIIPREGKRTHYGLIAQEVQELLGGKDFGGFIHDEETDTKGLRYDQFVPLLIKSIQELSQKIVILESKLK